MILYTPLMKTIAKKKISFEELNDKVEGGNILRTRLNSGEYISMETLDKICSVLDCEVSDVIQFEQGNQPSKIKLNWDKFDRILKGERYTYKDLTEYLHLGSGYFTHAKQRNSEVSEKIVGKICERLKCNTEDLI